MFLSEASVRQPCLVVVVETWWESAALIGLLALPVLAGWLLRRTARRHPSAEYLRLGRRPGGVLVARVAAAAVVLGLVGLLLAVVVPEGSVACTGGDGPWPVVGIVGAMVVLLGIVAAGVGWGQAVRADWLPVATVLATDVVILAATALVDATDPEATNGLLLLGLAVHGGCTAIAVRWLFAARDWSRLRRAQAGEAGRTLGAVWVFLAAYVVLGTFRGSGDVFDATVEAAVVGALTLGALAVTMGSGVTKFAEAAAAESTDGPFQPVVATGQRRSARAVAARTPGMVTRRVRRRPVTPRSAARSAR